MEAVKLKRSPLSLRRQCELLCIPRSLLYDALIPEKPENLKMVDWLQERGYPVGPKRVRRMFRLMGHETIYRRKNLTKGALKAYIKSYLLRGLNIERANQVWCADITYIPMAKGFMYMTAYIDVYSRKIMGWGISNSMSK
jgi:putative transposase